MILADMVTHLSEELRKGKTERNTWDLSKLPTFGSAKTPKREEAEYVTFCRFIFAEMVNRLCKELRKGKMEANTCDLKKLPPFTYSKEPIENPDL